MIGVVLIGGKSKRMGMPKACIEINGEKLAVRTAKLLDGCTEKVFLSGKKDQLNLVEDAPFPFIEDKYENIGPIAGILSAFEHTSKRTALLLTATDLPYLDQSTLDILISNRNPEKAITLFKQEQSGFLEPLCAIYETSAYARILEFKEKGIFAIHKMFSEKEMETIRLPNIVSLTNLNFPEQLKDIR